MPSVHRQRNAARVFSSRPLLSELSSGKSVRVKAVEAVQDFITSDAVLNDTNGWKRVAPAQRLPIASDLLPIKRVDAPTENDALD
jgi:hypothetical protein